MEQTDIQIPKRLYPNELPNVGDIVMIRINQFDDNGIYCELLEYGREGMITYNEVSKKKVKNIRHVIRIGAQEEVEVVHVDETKGYVDLSRKHINDEEKASCQERFTIARKLNNFFTRWSKFSGVNLKEDILWKHYDSESEHDNVYHTLVDDPESWYSDLPAEFLERIKKDYHHVFEKKASKVEVTFEMRCPASGGAAILQDAVDAGMARNSEDVPLQCVFTGKSGDVGTIFVLSTVSKEDNIRDHLLSVVATMEERVAEHGGLVKVC